ncbi:hypothetical protein LCGC14_2472160, partial [marine sediment metagenome]
LRTRVARLPTPTANRRSGLQSHGRNVVVGQLNADWVSLLMGFPKDLTVVEKTVEQNVWDIFKIGVSGLINAILLNNYFIHP